MLQYVVMLCPGGASIIKRRSERPGGGRERQQRPPWSDQGRELVPPWPWVTPARLQVYERHPYL